MAAAEDAPYLCYKELLPPSSFRICAFSLLKVLQQSSKVDTKTPNLTTYEMRYFLSGLYLYASSVSCLNVYKVNLNNQYSAR